MTNVEATACAVKVSWLLDPDLRALAKLGLEKLSGFWSGNRLEALAGVRQLVDEPGGIIERSNVYDIYHPAGTCQDISVTAAGIGSLCAVANNLTIVGSSIFPRLGISNPTLTIMALAIQQAEKISQNRKIQQCE